MTLPAEGTHDQVGGDALHGARVEGAVRLRRDPTERHTLGRERFLDALTLRLRLRLRLGRGRLQCGAHLARETRDRTNAEHLRRVALVCTDDPLAIPTEERVLRLRTRAVGAALRMAAEAGERVRATRCTTLDAMQLGCVADRRAVRAAAPPTVLGAKRVAEQLVANHEERVGLDVAALESGLRDGGVLDELPRLVRIEHAV